MKRLILIAMAVLCFAGAVFAQNSNLVKNDLSRAEIDRIIKEFSENEADFREALRIYIFTRNATVHTIGLGGQVTGTFRRDSILTFDSDGLRFEKILFAPVPTVPPGFVTKEDLEDLGGVNAFALEPAYIKDYNFTYLGKEKIDELNLYVFDVQPKVIPDPKKSKRRMFTGRIWVDDRDLMIVKSKGKGVPETKENKFPVVETWRANIDGKYWFPAYASSDDELIFDSGHVQKIKLRVTYGDYKQGRSEVRVLDAIDETVGDPIEDDEPEKPAGPEGMPPPVTKKP